MRLAKFDFKCIALSPFAGWHSGAKGYLESATHAGDGVAHNSWDERFEHPAKTWASATHRQFTMQAVAVAMAEATYKWMEEKCKSATRAVLGERARAQGLDVTPPSAAAKRQTPDAD